MEILLLIVLFVFGCVAIGAFEAAFGAAFGALRKLFTKACRKLSSLGLNPEFTESQTRRLRIALLVIALVIVSWITGKLLQDSGN